MSHFTRLIGIAVVVIASQVAAQSIDYERLFDLNAAQVLTEHSDDKQQRSLTLNGVRIEEVFQAGQRRYLAIDETEHGAVGCLFMMFAEVDQMLDRCARIGAESERATFQERYSDVIDFVARNSFPPVESELVRNAGQMGASRGQSAGTQKCSGDLVETGRYFFQTFISDEFLENLDASLSVDRLPVVNPCL